MARRGSLLGVINSIARESAKAARREEAERKRRIRQQAQQIRANEQASRRAITDSKRQAQAYARDAREQERINKENYLQSREDEVVDLNTDLVETINDLQTIIEHTLTVNDAIPFNSLKINSNFESFKPPSDLLKDVPEPVKPPELTIDDFVITVKKPSLVEKLFLGGNKRFQEEVIKAQSECEQKYKEAMNRNKVEYETALSRHNKARQDREDSISTLKSAHDAKKRDFESNKAKRNKEVDDFEASYRSGDTDAITSYNTMVLERSQYPEGFPQQFRIAYNPDSKELVVDYELPLLSVIPPAKEFRYIKTKDLIEEKPRKAAEINELYQDVVSAVTIRTIHEVFEADQGCHLDVAVFNGYVNAVDPASGKDIRPYLVSARAIKESFMDFNLARIDKRACLRNIGAQVSPQPAAMQPVKPIVDINMTDKRFVEYGDVLSGLDDRPNLMDLNPWEFEMLVSNLFAKMGLETKLTRSSRDGGVDAIAFDTRPILGGKVVIQAKRYKNTVGVSAVRDLYGTMLNEGANKGILVATSGYGPDAFTFAKDKPIELIDGGGLLYMLDKVGIEAKIIMPDEG